jgi:hypothetical protein
LLYHAPKSSIDISPPEASEREGELPLVPGPPLLAGEIAVAVGVDRSEDLARVLAGPNLAELLLGYAVFLGPGRPTPLGAIAGFHLAQIAVAVGVADLRVREHLLVLRRRPARSPP